MLRLENFKLKYESHIQNTTDCLLTPDSQSSTPTASSLKHSGRKNRSVGGMDWDVMYIYIL